MEIAEFCQSDADSVLEIQRAAYRPLFEKYRDEATNPYLESREKIIEKYSRSHTKGYIFIVDGKPVGSVRVMFCPEEKRARISALAVRPEYQGRGIAQEALLRIESLHPDVEKWQLDTISEEAGNCHLYEKLGYRQTGEAKRINENMTLVFYEKP